MNTLQLLACMNQDDILKKYYCNVFAADTIPLHPPTCYIVNTHPISKPGEHWYAVFMEEYFDSYGKPRGKNYNPVRIQGPMSSTCGQYCLYYLAHRVRGRSMNDIVNDFSTDYTLNDLCVAEYINRNFEIEMWKRPKSAPLNADSDCILDNCQICCSEK